MINRSTLTVTLLVFTAGVSADHATELAQSWLERMHRAAKTQNYDGTFVYSRDNSMNAMRIIHAVDKGGVRERLVSLDGNGREVIRSSDSVICILPDRETVVVEKGQPKENFPPRFPMRVGRLAAYYEFDVNEQNNERVAGQTTAQITITPKDGFRYGYRLWVDRQTGLLLKSRLLDDHSKPVEQFMFTRIEYLNEVPEKLLQPGVDGKAFTWYEADDREQAVGDRREQGWELTKTPPGFELDFHREHSFARSKQLTKHLVLTDGLASVSVFIEPHYETEEVEENLMGGSRMGAINAYGRVLNGYHVTAVGEVPQAAVRMISESVNYKK